MIRIAIFDTHQFERDHFESANKRFGYQLSFFEPRLTEQTATLAKDFDVVCSFVNDKVTAVVLKTLKENGIRLIALRSAGYNQVDLKAAKDLGLPVVRVPEYSPTPPIK